MFVEIVDYFYDLKFMVFFIAVNILLLLYHLQIISNCLNSQATGKTKHVLITGCDSGFGYKVALELNASKVKVFAGCLTEDGVKQLQEDTLFKGVPFIMDVRSKEDIEKAFNRIKTEVGELGLWAVISNAGILQPGIIEWQSTEEMQDCMNVNVWGAINVIKTMMPLVKKAKGRFVNVTSMAGRVWFGNHTAYSMSKYAFEAFSDGLRYEMKQWGITVHIIEPGIFKTSILDPVSITEQWNSLWEKQPDVVKNAYGKGYLQQVLMNIQEMINLLGSSNIKKVTDSMCHAVLSSNPKKRYVVGFDAWTIWMAVATFPTLISDFIVKIASKVPVPAAMKPENNLKQKVNIFQQD